MWVRGVNFWFLLGSCLEGAAHRGGELFTEAFVRPEMACVPNTFWPNEKQDPGKKKASFP